MAKAGTQEIELETFDQKAREAFWDRRVQSYLEASNTKELRIEAPPILAPTDDFTATILNGGKDYSLKSIREGQGYAGPNDYRMQDLQTNRPVKLSDFISPGTKIRYQGTFYIDRYADLVDLSNPTVLYPNPNHSWDGNDNTHVGGTGTGDGGTAGNNSRWRANIWSNHFMYMNLYEAGRTGSSVTEVKRLVYNYKVKEYGEGPSWYTQSEIYCKPSTSNSLKRARFVSSGSAPGYGQTHNTISTTSIEIVKSDGSLIGYNWHGGGPSDSETWAEIKEHIALGMLGSFAPLTSNVTGHCSYVSAISVDLDFTIQY